MTRAFCILLLCAACCLAQATSPEAEEDHLRWMLSEAGSSPIEFIRAVEKHLVRYPDSRRKADLERSLVRAAIDARDDDRILLYGERVLAREDDDPEILERVARVLLAKEDKSRAERALKYARRYEELVRSLEREKPASRRAQARWREEFDRGLAKALVMQARAAGNLESLDEAVTLAQKSYETYPTAESAREIGLLLVRMGRVSEAIPHFADAFVISDPRNTESDRAEDRQRMGELYRKIKGSEVGLGDLILEAYDRTQALLAERRALRRRLDPNAGLTNPMEFTLTGLDGDSLDLSSLRGKVLIFDFWATWCGPCRIQHPLYEEVKDKFRDRSDVVFLSINTDEDPKLVEPFLDENGWSKKVYFEDGLSEVLRISSIPTTIIASKRGDVVGRLVGFEPSGFVDLLTERIEEVLDQ